MPALRRLELKQRRITELSKFERTKENNMLDLLIDALAAMYDATLRGICIALTIAVVFPVVVFMFKKSPALLKAVGLW